MSAAELVIAGEREADRILDAIGHDAAKPDALHRAAMTCWATWGSPGLEGFLRRISKRLERTRASS